MRLQNRPGGYAYVESSIDFASPGVVALPGMAIERAAFPFPRPLADGFDAVRRYLERAGRPLAALCGFELRIPAATSLRDFDAFSKVYLGRLASWGLLLPDGTSPLARTNVAPTTEAPSVPSVLAFSYTVERPRPTRCFVVSGTPEKPEGGAHPGSIVRPGETDPEALLEKMRCVIEVIAGRVEALGAVWDASASFHLYSAHDVPFMVQRELMAEAGLSPAHGTVWHDAAPPVDDLALEADLRRYAAELTVEAS